MPVARMVRMRQEKDEYLANLLKERKSAFDKKMRDYASRLDKERANKLAERKRMRKEERRMK